MSYRQLVKLFFATCATVALAGCTSPTGGDAEDASAAVESVDSTPQEASESPDPDAESETEAAPEPTAAPELDPDTCLIGDWLIAEDQMQQFYDSIDTPAEFTVSGDTGLSFTEDSYEYTPDFTLKLLIVGQTGEGSVTGSVAGSYTTDGDIVTTSNENNDVSTLVTVGGQTMSGDDTFDSFMSISPINSAPYECTSQGPILMFENGSSDRVPMELTPRN